MGLHSFGHFIWLWLANWSPILLGFGVQHFLGSASLHLVGYYLSINKSNGHSFQLWVQSAVLLGYLSNFDWVLSPTPIGYTFIGHYIKVLVQFFLGLESTTFGVVPVHTLLGTYFLWKSQLIILFRCGSRAQCFLGICPILIGYYRSNTYWVHIHWALYQAIISSY